MAKGCQQIYEGEACGDWEKFPNHCIFMINEGQGDRSLTDYLKTEGTKWLRDFARYFASDGVYCTCIMANTIREAILQELKLRN